MNGPLFYLPPELLCTIFGYLKPKELLIAGFVCKKWWNASNYDEIWKKYLFKRFRKYFPSKYSIPNILYYLSENILPQCHLLSFKSQFLRRKKIFNLLYNEYTIEISSSPHIHAQILLNCKLKFNESKISGQKISRVLPNSGNNQVKFTVAIRKDKNSHQGVVEAYCYVTTAIFNLIFFNLINRFVRREINRTLTDMLVGVQ